ncbi:type III secretion system translocon subunit SctE [Chitinimonas sp. BJB300]|uniref:type III secretion system translocon subunit SctE n=1 Tax=Chitinimonas sp. BJB300 TaxID=1559339 RepID=UPI000C0EACBF|nr:type III secretion system translocon subunit SctE [Chitinimonas sp. BJB300]PHV11475.1 type III secretion protein [Chitinimonas sp. BJB300]TSJ88528.1 type III secretion system translocon protein [Chitinimonas sp. BJB300]
MDSIISLTGTGASRVLDTDEGTKTAASNRSVGAGALDPITPPPQRDAGKSAGSQFLTPPKPRDPVVLRAAEAALNRILQPFTKDATGKSLTLADIERTPMDAMTLAASLLGVKALGDTANLKSLALEIRTKGVEAVRLRQNEDLRKEVDKSIEDAQKAQKAGIIGAILDWVISIAEIVSGIVKIVTGVLTGNVGSVVGGVMDLSAGAAGIVKAICETAALIDPKNAEKYKAVAEVAGKVQLAFEMAGMFVDALSVGRGMMAARSAVKGTEAVMVAGSGEALKQAMKIGGETGKQAVSNVASAVGKAVADQAAAQVLKELTEKTVKNILTQGQLVQAFSKSAIEQMVTRAVEGVAKSAAKSAAEITAESLTREVVKAVQREVVEAAVKACIKSSANIGKAVVRAGATGVNGIAQGEIRRERAELQEMVQQLIAEGNFMQFLIDEFEKLKKQVNNDIRSLLDGAGKAISGGAESIQKNGAVLGNIANSIV